MLYHYLNHYNLFGGASCMWADLVQAYWRQPVHPLGCCAGGYRGQAQSILQQLTQKYAP